MRYLFLSAFRSEAATLGQFLAEFSTMASAIGIAHVTTLYLVDDLSTDSSGEVIEQYRRANPAIDVQVIACPTNLGNQGAMFYGLSQIDVASGSVLITFDCDGEDDVQQIPSILELARHHPRQMVLIERGRRTESWLFKFLFGVYKATFRFLTGKNVIPNNFMLVPGEFVDAIRRSPLAAVHFAYAALKLDRPRVVVTRARRPRYGGRTSQNLFMLVSHGLVGLMVFYEVVIAKLFTMLFVAGALATLSAAATFALPASMAVAKNVLVGGAVVFSGLTAGVLGLLLSAAIVLVLKLLVFTLAVGPPVTRRPRSGSGG